ncbi:MFS general substrate transporter [Ramaria rubella]|nr:MFS general substrate transporter [Ramaria rubella]
MTGFSALPVSADVEAGNQGQWQGSSQVLGPEWLKMPILTVGMMGLQIIWSVEMSNASPYLLSLGMSKSFMSMVFLAGPLSGLLVQPLIGVLSDGSRSQFGRRRPYIFFAVLVSFSAMYLFGFTREFASLVTTKGSAAVGLAIWSIYCIDFSINAVQAMDRALLVDILPVSEQERGNAWAGRMFGVGSVFGFFVGNVDLTLSLPFLGGTQLEILCVITSCLLVLSHFVTIFNVKERVLRKSTDGTDAKFGLWKTIEDIWGNFFELPRSIKQICLIQLFAWIGWFPVLFWTSLYVGGLHKRYGFQSSYIARAALEAEATRLGSRALLCNAIASLAASIICPFFVSGVGRPSGRNQGPSEHWKSGWFATLKSRWNNRRTCQLANLWAASHGIFAICMLSTFLIKDVTAATTIMTLSGFSWAITQWAPFALIAEAIHRESYASSHYILGNADDESDEEDTSIPLRDTRTNFAPGEEQLGIVSEGTSLDLSARISEGNDHVVGRYNDISHVGYATEDDGVGVSMENSHHTRSNKNRSIEDKAGIILGIHNVFIVIPQFIITGLSSILFAIMDPDKSVLPSHGTTARPGGLPGPSIGNTTEGHLLARASVSILPRAEGEATTRSADSVAVIFQIGGVSAAIACVLALRLAKELKRGPP